MQEKILIQTDFSQASLILIKTAIQSYPNTKFDILLVHGIHLTDSITELLFFSKRRTLEKISNQAFEAELLQIKNLFRYQIHSIRIELFTGANQAAFDHFVEANEINRIFVPNNYVFNSSYKKSRDLSAYILKSLQQKVHVSWAKPKDQFSGLALFQ